MFDSWPFWAMILLATAVFRLLPAAAARARAVVLAALGLAGAWVVLGLPAMAFGALVSATVWSAFVVGRLGGPLSREHPARFAAIAVVPVLIAWVAGKHLPAAGSAGAQLFFFVGTSYFLVKAWTLAKDRADGRLPNFDPLVAAAYFLHLPTYLSGPIHYYGEFDAGLRRPFPLSAVAVVDILLRLLWGMVKVMVLSPLIQPVSLLALKGAADPSGVQMAIGAIAFSAVLYLDFSGYSDMAIAVSRLVGVDVPENFKLPYLARNIREFWQRWHITFTRTLTAYIFVPLSRVLQRRWPGSPKLVMIIGYVVTFGFAGYWHGPTANFVVWGLYHAAGLIAYDLFRNGRLRRRLAGGAKAEAHPLLAKVQQWTAMTATFLYVSMGWIFFVLPLNMIFR